jgi:hypothetical protein
MNTHIEHKEGKVYDVAHLRSFDLELAKAGNPICTELGQEVRLLRVVAGLWAYDRWHKGSNSKGGWESVSHQEEIWLKDNLHLAPLAVRDGRPLHVGDVIEVPSINLTRTATGKDIGKDWINPYWRWPEEVQV